METQPEKQKWHCNCDLVKSIFIATVIVLAVAGLIYYAYYSTIPVKHEPLVSQPAQNATETKNTGLANPASVNCKDKGGTLEIKKRGDGGEYGICYFEDNRQCEEWALFRGECPVGGRKVTGYENDAQVYCAITGGDVDVLKKTCTKDKTVCDLTRYYNGTCPVAE